MAHKALLALLLCLIGCQKEVSDMHFGPGPDEEESVLEFLEDR